MAYARRVIEHFKWKSACALCLSAVGNLTCFIYVVNFFWNSRPWSIDLCMGLWKSIANISFLRKLCNQQFVYCRKCRWHTEPHESYSWKTSFQLEKQCGRRTVDIIFKLFWKMHFVDLLTHLLIFFMRSCCNAFMHLEICFQSRAIFHEKICAKGLKILGFLLIANDCRDHLADTTKLCWFILQQYWFDYIAVFDVYGTKRRDSF